MFLVGDASEWFLPMPVTLVLLMAIFVAWRRIWPWQRRLRHGVGTVVALVFVLLSTPGVINLGVRALEGPPQTVAQQLDALGFAALAGTPDRRLAPVSAETPASGMPAAQHAAHPLPQDAVRARAVIVPSSGASPPNGLQARLDQGGYLRLRAGIETWQRTGGLLVLMGGLGDNPEYSLAADMRRLAIGLGVPASAIRIVSGSWTTWQDISGAARLIKAEGGEDPARPVILVTSALHMPRSLAVAHQAGLDPIPIRSDYRQLASPGWAAWFPNNGAPWNARAMLHELIGVWYYRLRGRA